MYVHPFLIALTPHLPHLVYLKITSKFLPNALFYILFSNFQSLKLLTHPQIPVHNRRRPLKPPSQACPAVSLASDDSRMPPFLPPRASLSKPKPPPSQNDIQIPTPQHFRPIFAVILALGFGFLSTAGRIPQPAIPLFFMLVILACYAVPYTFPSTEGVYVATVIAEGVFNCLVNMSFSLYCLVMPRRLV